MVAPSSIKAWLKPPASPGGIRERASFSIPMRVEGLAMPSSRRKYRDSTRITLPSTAGSGRS
ncbi:hypothetical protein D3C86_2187620 [compost metagenome]